MQLLTAKPAKKDLERIPGKIYQKISKEILQLENNPFPANSKKLQSEDNLYRIRVGDYRVVYQVDLREKIVLVTKVKHRKDVYR